MVSAKAHPPGKNNMPHKTKGCGSGGHGSFTATPTCKTPVTKSRRAPNQTNETSNFFVIARVG